jgi:hypothetical protein
MAEVAAWRHCRGVGATEGENVESVRRRADASKWLAEVAGSKSTAQDSLLESFRNVEGTVAEAIRQGFRRSHRTTLPAAPIRLRFLSTATSRVQLVLFQRGWNGHN